MSARYRFRFCGDGEDGYIPIMYCSQSQGDGQDLAFQAHTVVDENQLAIASLAYIHYRAIGSAKYRRSYTIMKKCSVSLAIVAAALAWAPLA